MHVRLAPRTLVTLKARSIHQIQLRFCPLHMFQSTAVDQEVGAVYGVV
jgi:hypothetical protein